MIKRIRRTRRERRGDLKIKINTNSPRTVVRAGGGGEVRDCKPSNVILHGGVGIQNYFESESEIIE